MKDITLEMTVKVTKILKCADADVDGVITYFTDPKILKEEFDADDIHVAKYKVFIRDEKPTRKTKKKEN